MVGETTKDDKSPLLPERYPQGDFFVCDIFDAAPKGDMASMEHPIFSVATKPDRTPRHYQQGKTWLGVTPSVKGLATIHDRDVLIYCISQLMAALNDGRTVSQTLRLRAFDLLTATNRPTGGEAYTRLRAALLRLAGTRIETNITTGDTEQLDGFGLIESYRIVRETRDGRMQEVEIKLSDWVFNAIRHKEVLTLHRDYFRLRKPLERRMYELARKHCGRKDEWRVSLATLQKKCGSNSTAKEFKRLVSTIVHQDTEHHHIPDYAICLAENDVVVFRNRNTMPQKTAAITSASVPPLDAETYHDAHTMAEGWDIYHLEREWRAWITEPPRNPDEAFLGFCRKWVERRGPAQ